MIICVDFDGTIVDHDFPRIGKPVPYAIEYLKKFQKLDAKIILWTVRSNNSKYGNVLDQAVKYLNLNYIELYGINKNPNQLSWSNSPKAYSHLYIDDAAFGCPLIYNENFNRPVVDWSIVGPKVEKMLLG